jgi:ubiquinone/menaquinone biosynthesis C-methylase UbiE
MASISINSARLRLAELWRCCRCGGNAEVDEEAITCASCGESYAIRDGVVVVRDGVTANNEIARNFYNSPLWPKFRFWERFMFLCNGGERRARNRILRYLPTGEGLKLLDVAIGDGGYLPWLSPSWSIFGIDISSVQLEACKHRAVGRDVCLTLGQAEDLPVRDGAFDACLSIGAFNYFSDPEKALREMARAVKPGGTIVISDELPDLIEKHTFHKIGLPSVDHWLKALITKNLSPEFAAMIECGKKLDVAAIGRRVLPDCRYELIWQGAGYVMVGTAPR